MVINFIYLLSLVAWIGSIIFFSFFAAPVIFKTLEREKAGEVVGIIFPRYYLIGYISGVIALVILLITSQSFTDIKLILILIMLSCSVFAGQIVGPKARNLKPMIKSEEDSEKLEELKAQFGKLHSLSVKLNGAVLLLGLVLLGYTAKGLSLG
jgi:uncharacterized membrane protein